MSATSTSTSGQAGRMALANLLSASPTSTPTPTPYASQHTPGGSPTEMDESELIAAAALRGMRHASDTASLRSVQPTPALSLASSTSYSTLSDAVALDLDPAALDELNGGGGEHVAQDANKNFVTRVSAMPLVGSALRVYENSKNSSRVVKYAAQTVESSVMTISRPVIGRLPVNQLDEFACRQLDRWTPKSPGKASSPTSERDGISPMLLDVDQDRGRTFDRGTRGSRGDSAMSASPVPPLSQLEERSTPVAEDNQPGSSSSVTAEQQAVAVRSTWQAMLTEAGGISAAVSEESMKRLKYCLQWLQYATMRIDHQMLILREFIAKVTPPNASADGDVVVSAQHMRTLQDVKQDVVQTIRQVVDVVSKYAGGALPEPAKATVRAFILHLPQRWATRMQAVPGSGAGSVPGAASAAAHRILGLASESLDMMRSVTGVFKDSLDRAETWVERLRVVGIQRQQQQQLEPLASGPYRSYPPSDAGDYDDVGSVGASSPVSARLSPNPSFKQLNPSGGSSGSLGASLDALSLAALHHQQQQHQQLQQQLLLPEGYQRASGPRFTVGPSSGAMDVDDD
ncbi:Opi1-domain-containing protein [Auriculariales sp. MPI-PUGE-AT-0066]|nr:Opi1-domain-containing protein [Auriculariales sp. MPI-PUGE-AT-0066]